ncbi:MAG: hypothetical protein ACP5O1_11405 [Phycisphaerae bacterium]
MTPMSDSQFAKEVLSRFPAAPAFKPFATYDPDGDCIEFFTSDDTFYAERVDDLLTVYRSQDTGEVIGSLVKGVSGLFRKLGENLPGLCIEIQDGSVKLEHLFLLAHWARESPEIRTITYKKLIGLAEDSNVSVEMSLPA